MTSTEGWIKGPFGWWWVGAGPRPTQTPDAGAPPPSIVVTPPFVPGFRDVQVFDSWLGTFTLLNKYYFADHATAEWIAKKYGDGNVYEEDVYGPGPYSATGKYFMTKIADGRFVNAGVLASFYDRNPEAQFPGLADKLIRAELAKTY